MEVPILPEKRKILQLQKKKNISESQTASKELVNKESDSGDTEVIPSDADGVNYDYIATKYCECGEDASKTLARLEEAKKANNKKVIDEIVPNYNKLHKDVVECCINKKKDHTKIKLEKPKLAEALKKKCPDMPSSLQIQIIMKTIF